MEIAVRSAHIREGIYLNSKDLLKSLSSVNMILIINPYAIHELRDRGLLYYQLECFTQAFADLRHNQQFQYDLQIIGKISPDFPIILKS